MNNRWARLTRNWKLTRAIDKAFAAGDAEALSVFRTGTLAATFTRGGSFARTNELVAYAALVTAKDGCAYRYRRLVSAPEDAA